MAWVARVFLVAYLASSGFLNQVNLDKIRGHYQHMMAGAPRVDLTPSPPAG